jgi:hypothetical protein
MAGQGAGDGRAADAHAPANADTAADARAADAPATDTPAADMPATTDAPAAILRWWDQAEAQLFPLIMARPDEYERSLALIQEVLARLRHTCAEIPALLAEAERGEELAADVAAETAAQRDSSLDHDNAGAPSRTDTTGMRLDLIAAAACAMRYRELRASTAARGRLHAFARARARGEVWAVVDEAGDQSRAPYLPYQRVEAHIPSGRALIVSIEPDETLSRAVWRIDEATLDPATGHLVIGAELGSYADAGEFGDALASARLRLP